MLLPDPYTLRSDHLLAGLLVAVQPEVSLQTVQEGHSANSNLPKPKLPPPPTLSLVALLP